MHTDEKFAQWASLFVSSMNTVAADVNLAEQKQEAEKVQYEGVTQAASSLLQAIDAGGIPAFVTPNLLEIAKENGIEVTDDCTPNEIIEAIRNKAVIPSVATPQIEKPR